VSSTIASTATSVAGLARLFAAIVADHHGGSGSPAARDSGSVLPGDRVDASRARLGLPPPGLRRVRPTRTRFDMEGPRNAELGNATRGDHDAAGPRLCRYARRGRYGWPAQTPRRRVPRRARRAYRCRAWILDHPPVAPRSVAGHGGRAPCRPALKIGPGPRGPAVSRIQADPGGRDRWRGRRTLDSIRDSAATGDRV
jgi:hypothetical protein